PHFGSFAPLALLHRPIDFAKAYASPVIWRPVSQSAGPLSTLPSPSSSQLLPGTSKFPGSGWQAFIMPASPPGLIVPPSSGLNGSVPPSPPPPSPLAGSQSKFLHFVPPLHPDRITTPTLKAPKITQLRITDLPLNPLISGRKKVLSCLDRA